MIWVESTARCTILYLVDVLVDAYPNDSAEALLQCEQYQRSLWTKYYMAILSFSLGIGIGALVLRTIFCVFVHLLATLVIIFTFYLVQSCTSIMIISLLRSIPSISITTSRESLVPPCERKWRWE